MNTPSAAGWTREMKQSFIASSAERETSTFSVGQTVLKKRRNISEADRADVAGGRAMPYFIPYETEERIRHDAKIRAAQERAELERMILVGIHRNNIRHKEIAALLDINPNSVTKKLKEFRFRTDEALTLKAYIELKERI